jgi:hypothetical protein
LVDRCIEEVDFKLPRFFVEEKIGRRKLYKIYLESTVTMYENLFNTDSEILSDMGRNMDECSIERRTKLNAYLDREFVLGFEYSCSLRIMRGRKGNLVIALCIQFDKREIIIEEVELFAVVFGKDIDVLHTIYGEHMRFDNLEINIRRDTYKQKWLVIKELCNRQVECPNLTRTGLSIVFSGRMWKLLQSCLSTRVPKVLGDLKNICMTMNTFVEALKVKARSTIKKRCGLCQHPDEEDCKYTTQEKINEICSDIVKGKKVKTSSSILKFLWTKMDKLFLEIGADLRAEMRAEEDTVLKFLKEQPDKLLDYEPPVSKKSRQDFTYI